MTEHINTISRLPNELCPAFVEWCVRGGHEIKIKKDRVVIRKGTKTGEIFAKVYEEIKSKDAGKASEFAFCMAGNAIGCLFSVTKPTKVQEVKSLVFQCTDYMAVQAMQNRKIKFS